MSPHPINDFEFAMRLPEEVYQACARAVHARWLSQLDRCFRIKYVNERLASCIYFHRHKNLRSLSGREMFVTPDTGRIKLIPSLARCNLECCHRNRRTFWWDRLPTQWSVIIARE